VGGAVSDRADAMDSGSNSPAARAARISGPEPVAEPVAQQHRGRRRWLVAFFVLLIVAGAATAGYAWTQKQYFVGKDGNEVAVFRGVNAHFGPFSLYSVVENSDLRMSDLTVAAGSQVSNGITASSRSDAEAILSRLQDEQKPLCASLATPSSTPSRSASPSRTPVRTPSRTPARSPAKSSAKSTVKASASKTTPLPTPSPLPSGVVTSAPPECR
jgi:protein phosphatase